MTQAPEKFVGGGVLRKEDPALVTGRANWTDNITLPGMLHAVFMRSPYAHAKITSVDVSAARATGAVSIKTTSEYDRRLSSTSGKALEVAWATAKSTPSRPPGRSVTDGMGVGMK